MTFIGRTIRRRTSDIDVANAIRSCRATRDQILDMSYQAKMRQESQFRQAVLRLQKLTGEAAGPALEEFYHAHTPRSKRRGPGIAHAVTFNLF